MNGDMNDLGIFLLPVRDTENDKFYATVMADGFYSTPKNNENSEERIAFLEWYFSSDYYKEYVAAKGINSTMKSVKIDNPLISGILEKANATQIVYDGGNKDFKAISDAISFDVKKLGQEMLAGKNLDDMMNDLNSKWKKARAK